MRSHINTCGCVSIKLDGCMAVDVTLNSPEFHTRHSTTRHTSHLPLTPSRRQRPSGSSLRWSREPHRGFMCSANCKAQHLIFYFAYITVPWGGGVQTVVCFTNVVHTVPERLVSGNKKKCKPNTLNYPKMISLFRNMILYFS